MQHRRRRVRIAFVIGPNDRAGSGKVRYNLYLDSLRTQIWGDGTSGTEVFTGSASTGATAVPVFGRVFGSQDVSAAIYIDTVIVTLDF